TARRCPRREAARGGGVRPAHGSTGEQGGDRRLPREAGARLRRPARGVVSARDRARGTDPSDRSGRMGWKVVVDFDVCESNAICMGIAPEVFEVRDDDFLYILDETPPDELRPKVEQAVRQCPKQAITIVD